MQITNDMQNDALIEAVANTIAGFFGPIQSSVQICWPSGGW